MLIFRMHYRRFPYRECALCIKIWNVLEICLNPPHSQNASPTPKLERLLFDWKTVPGLKVAHNLTLNINRIEGFQIWHFTVGKDILLCCHVNEWKRHLVTKRWPFPFAAYYWGGWGGGAQLYQTLWMAKCNSWKLKVLIITVWQDGRKEGKEAGKDGRNEGQDLRWNQRKRFIFRQTCVIKLNSRMLKSERSVCHPSVGSTDVCTVVNISSSPLPDGVKGICCSPGQRRPHFYTWAAVNIAEWHTTKVGCAAALSLLNGMLAFSFTSVSRTHTPQSICTQNVWKDFFISSWKQEIRMRRGERENGRDTAIRQKRAREHIHMHITFHRKTIYILSPYYVNFEWPLQIILLHR